MRTLILLALLSPGAAAAHGFNIDGLWIGTGVNAGYGTGGDGFLVGAEVSAVEFEDATWLGGYLDVLHAAESEATRVSFGLEAGYFLAGIDAGMSIDVESRAVGARGRFIFSLAMQSLYVGGLWFPDEDPSLEVGVLVKLPYEID